MPTMTADTRIRDQLKGCRDRLSSLREQLAEARREQDAAKDVFGKADFANDVKVTDTKEFKDAQAAVGKVRDLDQQIAEAKEEESGYLALLDTGGAPVDSGGGGGGSNGHAYCDARRLLAESDAYQAARTSGAFNSSARFGTVVLGELAGREETASFLRPRADALPPATPGPVSTPAGGVPADYRGIIAPANLNLQLLNLIPTGTTDSNVVNYVQITGIPDSAAGTAELAMKPEAGLETVDATAPVRTIAQFLKSSRQSLDDTAGLATLINAQLPYGVRKAVLDQILTGDGTGQNLLGLYETTGIGEPEAEEDDTLADAILRAITVIVLSDSDPNFVVLNPVDWQDLLLMKNTQGNYIYGNPGQLPGGMVAQTIWGLTIATNRLVPAGRPLVGDAMGCSLLVREGVNVKTSDSDQDDFVKNRVTILAETRVAFPVWRPSAFAIAALAEE